MMRFAFAAVLLVSAAIAPAGVYAQDLADIAAEELKRQRFNWYDQESGGAVKDLWRRDPGSSVSENRKNIASSKASQQTPFNFNGRNNWTWMRVLVWGLVIVVLLSFVAFMVWLLFQMEERAAVSRNAEEYDEQDLQYRIEQLPFVLANPSKGDLSALALEAARTGNYSKGIMLLFSHVLILLDRSELIKLRKGKTNRQYLGELRQHPQLADY